MPMRQSTIKLPNGVAAELESFVARERLSELFVIEAIVLCPDEGADFFSALGEAAIITVFGPSAETRYFHGLIFDSEYVEQVEAGHRYRLTLRPWLYPLTRNLNFKIFQNQTAVDIVKSVLDAYGGTSDFTNVSARQQREYCVQYRESDFDFISRLLQEEGIYFYVSHGADQHKVVFCDGAGAHAPTVELSYAPPQSSGRLMRESVWKWSERISSTAENEVRIRTFDFTAPSAPKETSSAINAGADGKAVVYEYPAPARATPEDGLAVAQRRADALKAQQRLYLGVADSTELACGCVLTLSDHPVARFAQDYIVLALTYTLGGQTYRTGSDAPVQDNVVFEAVPKESGWRPPFTSPRPVARGPETATVVGPTKDDVHTDTYGRVKVAFHWDREVDDDRVTPKPDPTCWIRVSSDSAGSGFGHVALPRVGQEVIVDFLDGDPDRPIVTGRVYNSSMVQPYALPDAKSRSVWRSRTIGASGSGYEEAEEPPGDAPGSNEIRMEDSSGKEEFWVHAQRFMRTWVRLDEDHKVARDQTRRVGRNRTTNIKKNDQTTVETGDLSLTVQAGKRTETISKNDALTVEQGDKSVTVSLGKYDTTVSTGNYSVKAEAGAVTIEAMQKIELKVGANSVVIDQTGVTVKGLMIKQEATVQWGAKGAITQLESDAMTTVKGGIVMIN